MQLQFQHRLRTLIFVKGIGGVQGKAQSQRATEIDYW